MGSDQQQNGSSVIRLGLDYFFIGVMFIATSATFTQFVFDWFGEMPERALMDISFSAFGFVVLINEIGKLFKGKT